MLEVLAVLTLCRLVAWLLVESVRTLYAGRPVYRIWIVMGGYLAACICAAIVVTLGLSMNGILPAVLSGGLEALILLPLMLPFVAGFIALYALLPAGVIIICADLARIRSPFFYGPAGAAAVALPTHFLMSVKWLHFP